MKFQQVWSQWWRCTRRRELTAHSKSSPAAWRCSGVQVRRADASRSSSPSRGWQAGDARGENLWASVQRLQRRIDLCSDAGSFSTVYFWGLKCVSFEALEELRISLLLPQFQPLMRDWSPLVRQAQFQYGDWASGSVATVISLPVR